MDTDDARAKARALYEARRTRTAIAPFTDAEPQLTMADGYAVQRELVALLTAGGDRVVGYKVGATSVAMQRSIGLDSPDYGPVLASTVHRDGDTLAVDDFVAPKLEAEIGLVLGRGLEGPVTAEQARAAVGEVFAAVEIVDSRIADWRIRLADTVADLASNGAVVVSGRRVPAAGLDLRPLRMRLFRDDVLVDEGVGAAALGDPIHVLVWLAGVLAEHGVPLQAGQIVMTGALHAAVPLLAGQVYRAEFEVLGTLIVRTR